MMITSNLICAIEMYIFYGILYIGVPAVVLHQFIKGRSLGFRLLFYQISALCYITLASFALSFIHIYNSITTWLVFVIIPIFAAHIFARKRVMANIRKFKQDQILRHSIKESYKAKLKRFRGNAKKWPGIIFRNYFNGRILQLITFILITIFIFAVIGYYHLHNYSYMCSDEPTHIYWINSLINNEAFPVGMYPHGTHFMVGAMCSMFGLLPTRAWCCFSMLANGLISMGAFLTIRGIFKSKAAPIFSVVVFWVVNIFGDVVFNRLEMGLPMEVGMYAYFIMIYGLVSTVRDKRKSSLLLMAMGVAGTSFIHFYVTIFAAFTVLAFAIVFFIPIFKRKLAVKMIAFGLIGIIVSFVPYGVGFLCGYSFEQSIAWGFSIFNANNKSSNTEDTEDETTDESDEETNTDTDTGTDEVLDSEYENQADVDDSSENYESEEENADVAQEYEITATTVIYRYSSSLGYYTLSNISGIIDVLKKAVTVYIAQNTLYGMMLYGICILSFLYGVIGLIISLARKKNNTVKFLTFMFIPVAWGISFIVHLMPMIGMTSIIVTSRSGEFISMMSMLVLAVPVQIIYDLISITKVKEKYIDLVMSLLVMAGLGAYFKLGDVRTEHQLLTSFVMEEMDIYTVETLEKTEEKYTWTVISTTNSRMGILYNGYHYEITELLRQISINKDIYIPTQDIYVMVETQIPQMGDKNTDGSDFLEKTNPITAEAANENLSSIGIYINNAIDSTVYLGNLSRQVLSSKLYYWMEKIKEIYPDDVTVFAQDECCTVYKIHQDPYFLLNLKVDYSDLVEEALAEEVSAESTAEGN